MLYKLILIDDHVSSLKFLKELIPWEEHGFVVSQTFSDSLEAIEYLKENKVDVIISDIAMPGADGLEVVKFCHDKGLDTKIILLSAYRDFKYAQASIQYKNVVDYLTKPLEYKSLIKALKKISSSFINEQKNGFTSMNDEFLRLQIFSNLLCGFINSTEELESQLCAIGLPISSEDFACTVITTKIEDFTDNLQTRWQLEPVRIYHAINSMTEFENEDRYASIAMYSYNTIVWIIIHKNNEYEKNIDEFTESIIFNLKNLLNTVITISNTKTYPSLSELTSKNAMDEIHLTDKRASDESSINKILELMNKHYGENITLTSIAKRVYMSPAYLSRYFKTKTGKKFIDALTDIRMKNAAKMLKETELSINEIANLTGYEHIGNFYERFKKYYNMTPSDYKKKSPSDN